MGCRVRAYRGIEQHILGTCRGLGLGITACGALSHGLLTGPRTFGRRRPVNR